MTRLNSEKFQNFQLKSKSTFFSEIHENDKHSEFWDFNESTLYMTFTFFPENVHIDNLRKKIKKSYIG